MIKLVRIEDVPDSLLYIGMKLGVISGYTPGILLKFKSSRDINYARRTILVYWNSYGYTNFEYESSYENYHNIGVEVGKCKKLNALWQKEKLLVMPSSPWV